MPREEAGRLFPADRLKTKQQAIQTHEQVGKEVRAAIQRIGGTLPEHIPPAEPIKDFAKRLKTARPKLVLDGPEARGLLGDGTIGGEGPESSDELPPSE